MSFSCCSLLIFIPLHKAVASREIYYVLARVRDELENGQADKAQSIEPAKIIQKHKLYDLR